MQPVPFGAPRHVELARGQVDLARRVLVHPSGTQSLSPTEARLLAYLVVHGDEVVSKERLLTDVWGYQEGVRSRTVFSTIDRLRKKIEVDPKVPAHVITESGGYCFRPSATATPALALPGDDALVGRVAAQRELSHLLSARVPLVTVVGPGGVGKTTLARRAAALHGPALEGGCVWVDAVDAQAPADLWARIGTALALPATPADASELAARLARTPRLLVLDDLDAFVPAAASLLPLLGVDGLVVLATSRADLQLPGERVLRLGPMSAPSARSLLRRRARAAGVRLEADDDDVDALTAAVDRLPLAIELLAPRLLLVPPRELAARRHALLGLARDPGRDDRHASLSATIASSWQRLSARDAAALSALAVVRGTLPVDLAEHLVGPDPDDPLDVLARLHRCSLLSRTRERRLQLLAPIRAYALERLDRDAERGARARWLAWADDVTARESAHLDGPTPAAAAARLARELPLLLDALGGTIASVRHARICVDLVRVSLRGGAQPGHAALLDEAVAVAEAPTGDARLATRAYLWRVEAKLHRGQHAVDDADRAIALADGIGDHSLRIEARILRGRVHRRHGELAEARAVLAGEVARAADAGLTRLHARALVELAATERSAGRLTDSIRHLEAALVVARAGGHPRQTMIAVGMLGSDLRRVGRVLDAEVHLRRALALAEELGDHGNAAHLRGNLANVCVVTGDIAAADRLVTAALSYYRRHARLQSEAFALQTSTFVRMARGQRLAARQVALEALETFEVVGHAHGRAYASALLGRLLHAEGDAGAAALRYRAALDGTDATQAPHLAAQFSGLAALAAADAGDMTRARALQGRLVELAGSTPRAAPLLAFVDRFLTATADERADLRDQLASTALDRDMLW